MRKIDNIIVNAPALLIFLVLWRPRFDVTNHYTSYLKKLLPCSNWKGNSLSISGSFLRLFSYVTQSKSITLTKKCLHQYIYSRSSRPICIFSKTKHVAFLLKQIYSSALTQIQTELGFVKTLFISVTATRFTFINNKIIKRY